MSKIKEQTDNITYMLREMTGDLVEHSLGDGLEGSRWEAPVLEKKMRGGVWYRIPIEEAMSGDGSGYHIYARYKHKKKLCIILSGGGIAWNRKMAAYPTTGARKMTWQPHYYWNNLRPVTQIMNINVGITDTHRRNPFRGWSMAVISYSTADLHVGNSSMEFVTDEGQTDVLHFNGYNNFTLAMDHIRELFPEAETILIAGDSAGAFAVPALAPEILTTWYPTCNDVTVLSDSALLEREGWEYTLKNIWHAPDHLVHAAHGSDLTYDWTSLMMSRLGSRCRYLYASSVHDYLLSAYQREVTSGEFSTDENAQADYAKRLAAMIERMQHLPRRVHFFINDHPMVPVIGRGGSVHTCVRTPQFFSKVENEVSMAQWLRDATEGKLYDIGLDLLPHLE